MSSARELKQLMLVTQYKRLHENVKQQPKCVAAHLELALYLLNKCKEYPAAERVFRQILKLEPHMKQHHNNLALAKEHIGEYDLAAEGYKKALEIDPRYANAHYNYAELLRTHFYDYATAERHYIKALEVQPDDVDVLYAHGLMLMRNMLKYDDARRQLTKAAEIDSKDSAVTALLAELLYENFQDYNEAAKYYRLTVAADPADHLSRYQLALILKNSFTDVVSPKKEKEHKLKTAARDDDIKIKNNNNSTSTTGSPTTNTKGGEGESTENDQLPDSSRGTLDTSGMLAATSVPPQSPQSDPDNLGSQSQEEMASAPDPALVYEHNEACCEAMNLLEEAVRAKGGRTEYHFVLAELAEEMEDWKQARRRYKHVLRLDPHDSHAHLQLAMLLEAHFSKPNGALFGKSKEQKEIEKAIKDHYKWAATAGGSYTDASTEIDLLENNPSTRR